MMRNNSEKGILVEGLTKSEEKLINGSLPDSNQLNSISSVEKEYFLPLRS